jgi:4-amino-4-deoxy-L-arabinose transferase-like glycosyltransferase
MTAGRQSILLFAGVSVLFLWGSWQLPFLGPDEPRYAQIAREMFDTGDLIVPKLEGFAWFEKPILLYWLIALSYACFGVNEFAARLPSALAAFGSVGFLFFTIRKIANHTTALISSAVLATSAFFVTFSHSATFDMLLTFCVTAALCCFLQFENSKKTSWLYWMYAFTGIGILAKGFASPAIIGITLLGYFLVSRNMKSILQMKLWQGAILVAVIAAIWFLPVSMIYGVRFWDEFVYQHHFVRYTSSYYHRSQGFFFYIPVLVAGTYPWTFVPFSTKTDKSDLRRFAFCWLFFPILFFSLSRSKLPGYILPAIPGFAIWAGLAFSNLKKTRVIPAALGLNLILAAFLVWIAPRYSVPTSVVYWLFAVIAILITASALFFHLRKWTAALLIYSQIPVAAMIIFLISIFPHLPWSDSKELSLRWIQKSPGNARLVPYNIYDFAPAFYTNGRLDLNPQGYPNIITNASELHRYLIRAGQAHVLVGNEELQWMQRADFWKIDSILGGKNISIVELHPK